MIIHLKNGGLYNPVLGLFQWNNTVLRVKDRKEAEYCSATCAFFVEEYGTWPSGYWDHKVVRNKNVYGRKT